MVPLSTPLFFGWIISLKDVKNLKDTPFIFDPDPDPYPGFADSEIFRKKI
jgi:hypothetical protein